MRRAAWWAWEIAHRLFCGKGSLVDMRHRRVCVCVRVCVARKSVSLGFSDSEPIQFGFAFSLTFASQHTSR